MIMLVQICILYRSQSLLIPVSYQDNGFSLGGGRSQQWNTVLPVTPRFVRCQGFLTMKIQAFFMIVEVEFPSKSFIARLLLCVRRPQRRYVIVILLY